MSKRAPIILSVLGTALLISGGYLYVRQLNQGAKPAPAASVTPAIPVDLKPTLPFDPSIATGKLPNGLTYFVRANKQPEHRAELRLVVNAGSVLEDDDQR